MADSERREYDTRTPQNPGEKAVWRTIARTASSLVESPVSLNWALLQKKDFLGDLVEFRGEKKRRHCWYVFKLSSSFPFPPFKQNQ